MAVSYSMLSGVPEGFDAQLLARAVIGGGGPAIHVARDDARLDDTRAALRFFAPDLPAFIFPAWDCLPFDRISPNTDVSAARMATLATLAAGFERPFVLLTTLNAVTQYVPPKATLRDAVFTATIGNQLDETALRSFLAHMGFVQAPTVLEPGDYAIRGGLIDLYPPGDSGPIRLDLFGDVLEGARRFDPQTQRTIERLDHVALAPVSEVILDAPSIARFRSAYRHEFGAPRPDDPLYAAVSAGRKHQGVEHWAPFFHARMDSIFDYLPDAPVYFDDQIAAAHDARWSTITEQYRNRAQALSARNKLDQVYHPCPPEMLYLDAPALAKVIKKHDQHHLRALPQPVGLNVRDAGGRSGRNFAPERQAPAISLFGALADHMNAKRADTPVVVASYSKGARERLGGLLADGGLEGAVDIGCFGDIPRGAKGVYLTVWALDQGFETSDLTVISEQDVLGERLIRTAKKRRRAKDFLTEATALSPGDLVVHLDHGIGRYTGLETITAAGAPHECIALSYADNDRLYLPVENIELLSRYGHDEGLLDRLGSGAWQAKKAKLKKRIRDMADRLIRVAAERALRRAPILSPRDGATDSFAARFPYSETDDQLHAIEDSLSDLASGRPMDRLICGDVGFGKTEVALRAAYVAAMAGVQVALVAPTTLLARQHFLGFQARFHGLPVTVRPLSRFVSPGDAALTRDGLAKGSVDIVIGTHAVLAKKIRFHNLGLLVIDEEQKFGVGHKERLKQLRSDIHVLTLTATPIPRTLQMSLSGVRDLSIIGTPPVDRLSIRTYVSEFDAITIREALLREHYRGGQSFYVVPRISDLGEIEEFLADQLPELTTVVAHGQMAAGELDRRMNDFYDGKYDVLLATTIVESGLDIPTANTMIIHRADMFGLAQLYQIRGRVGRSKTRAYAYLTTKPRVRLTGAAAKRLRVLGTLDSLGAGFTLASQDLDIRGAGNLLGDQQSGQVREVGYELYQSMLEEAIANMKAGALQGLSDADETWAPVINLGVPVLIPEKFVPDLDVRLGLYRRLSSLHTKVELEGFAAELIDRFGKLPREVNTLLNIVRVKSLCKRAGIAQLDGGPKGATIRFHNDKFANPAGLVAFLEDQKGLAKIRDNKVVVRRSWPTGNARVKGAFAIAQDLAKLAKV